MIQLPITNKPASLLLRFLAFVLAQLEAWAWAWALDLMSCGSFITTTPLRMKLHYTLQRLVFIFESWRVPQGSFRMTARAPIWRLSVPSPPALTHPSSMYSNLTLNFSPPYFSRAAWVLSFLAHPLSLSVMELTGSRFPSKEQLNTIDYRKVF